MLPAASVSQRVCPSSTMDWRTRAETGRGGLLTAGQAERLGEFVGLVQLGVQSTRTAAVAIERGRQGETRQSQSQLSVSVSVVCLTRCCGCTAVGLPSAALSVAISRCRRRAAAAALIRIAIATCSSTRAESHHFTAPSPLHPLCHRCPFTASLQSHGRLHHSLPDTATEVRASSARALFAFLLSLASDSQFFLPLPLSVCTGVVSDRLFCEVVRVVAVQ